jgi:hypothetical protein
MNKKGVLGLRIAQGVILILVVLVVLGVAGIIAAVNLRDVAEGMDTTSVTVNNESVANLSEVASTLAYNDTDYRNPSCAISLVMANATEADGYYIDSNNYTLTSPYGTQCTLTFTGSDTNINGTALNVTYTVTYSEPESYYIATNYTDAISDFFDENATLIAILVVVVIIAAIGIVITIISRFGGGRGEIGVGKKRSYGSDTVMGV